MVALQPRCAAKCKANAVQSSCMPVHACTYALNMVPPSAPPLKGVVVVYYKYENTTLEGLLAQVGKSLQGGRALSIALLMHGHTGYFKINKEKVGGVRGQRSGVRWLGQRAKVRGQVGGSEGKGQGSSGQGQRGWFRRRLGAVKDAGLGTSQKHPCGFSEVTER